MKRRLRRTIDRILFPGFLALLLTACGSLPTGQEYRCEPISSIPGPEDIVIDKWNNPPRLLVSSTDRRNPDNPGQIYAVDLKTSGVKPLPRQGEMNGLSFHPHGLDIIQDQNGRVLLYVITHRREGQGAKHAVLVYAVEPDRLVLKKILEDPLLISPNDLAGQPDGGIYVSNDRSAKGGMLELALKLKRSTIVYYDGFGTWSIAAERLAMANGLAIAGGKLFVAATREDAIFSFIIQPGGTLSNKRLFASVKGPDNFFVSGNNLLVGAHLNTLALMRHSGNPEKKAPSVIYQIYLSSGDTQPLFTDDGTKISGASVGVLYGDILYIGQIFDDFILKCIPSS
ncbi:MAG: SMP-30/gluconolactonase/LRE family protein [Deltaproteobacteria bacterium]|nr:SMP-30/gluconolactonase/LRE family protein [Deltaproteobacteria bacterium]MBW2052761.1 SMP-30/gluconolactonase/LRE family protein [Deltaproteobacteria bacterium]